MEYPPVMRKVWEHLNKKLIQYNSLPIPLIKMYIESDERLGVYSRLRSMSL